MAFTLIDKGGAVSDLQTVLWSAYFGPLAASIAGSECCLSGLAITANSNMVPSIAKGAVLSAGALFAVAAATGNSAPTESTAPLAIDGTMFAFAVIASPDKQHSLPAIEAASGPK